MLIKYLSCKICRSGCKICRCW